MKLLEILHSFFFYLETLYSPPPPPPTVALDWALIVTYAYLACV